MTENLFQHSSQWQPIIYEKYGLSNIRIFWFDEVRTSNQIDRHATHFYTDNERTKNG